MYSKVKELCELKGISVSKLEIELGFSRGSICKWSVNTPSVDKVKSVADYFGVTIDCLLEKDEQDEYGNSESVW